MTAQSIIRNSLGVDTMPLRDTTKDENGAAPTSALMIPQDVEWCYNRRRLARGRYLLGAESLRSRRPQIPKGTTNCRLEHAEQYPNTDG